jgi:hypothetical protein
LLPFRAEALYTTLPVPTTFLLSKKRRDSFQGAKRPEHKAVSSAGIKNVWGYTSIPSLRLHGFMTTGRRESDEEAVLSHTALVSARKVSRQFPIIHLGKGKLEGR